MSGTEPFGSVDFTALLLESEMCGVGDCLLFDSAAGYWRIASSANRTSTNVGTQAIARTAQGGSVIGSVEYQTAGVLNQSVSGLDVLTPTNTKKLVRTSSTGRLERIDSYTSGDDVVGYATWDGRVALHIGLPWDMIAALAGGGGATPAGVAGDIQVKQDASTFNIVGFWKAVDNAGTLRATYWDDSDGFTERAGIQFSAGTFNDPQVFPDYGLIRVSSFFYSFAGGHLITLVKPDNSTEWSLLAVAGGEFYVGDPTFVIPTILSGNGITIAPGTAGASVSGNLSVTGMLTLTNPLAGGSVAAATTSTAGTMSAADKTKLDGMQPEGSAVTVSAMAIDWSAGSVFTKTLAAGANTFTFSNATSGRMITVRVTGAASTLTWPSVKWAGGVAPTQTASGTDVYTFIHDGTSIYGSVVQAMA